MKRTSGWDVAVAVILVGMLGLLVLGGVGFLFFARMSSAPMHAPVASSSSSGYSVAVASTADPILAEDPSFAPTSRVAPQSLGLTFTPISQEHRATFNLEAGIVVSEILPDSTAHKAGVQVGDLIVKANGMPVTTVDEFQQRAGIWKDNDIIHLLVQRATPDGLQDHTVPVRVMSPQELADLIPLTPPLPANP